MYVMLIRVLIGIGPLRPVVPLQRFHDCTTDGVRIGAEAGVDRDVVHLAGQPTGFPVRNDLAPKWKVRRFPGRPPRPYTPSPARPARRPGVLVGGLPHLRVHRNGDAG